MFLCCFCDLSLCVRVCLKHREPLGNGVLLLLLLFIIIFVLKHGNFLICLDFTRKPLVSVWLSSKSGTLCLRPVYILTVNPLVTDTAQHASSQISLTCFMGTLNNFALLCHNLKQQRL